MGFCDWGFLGTGIAIALAFSYGSGPDVMELQSPVLSEIKKLVQEKQIVLVCTVKGAKGKRKGWKFEPCVFLVWKIFSFISHIQARAMSLANAEFYCLSTVVFITML